MQDLSLINGFQYNGVGGPLIKILNTAKYTLTTTYNKVKLVNKVVGHLNVFYSFHEHMHKTLSMPFPNVQGLVHVLLDVDK